MPNALKAYWQVTAGVIPGEPEPEFSRCWKLTSADVESAARTALFEATREAALAYARVLMDPARFNVVTIEFVWL
jgi:hypothetical protein